MSCCRRPSPPRRASARACPRRARPIRCRPRATKRASPSRSPWSTAATGSTPISPPRPGPSTTNNEQYLHQLHCIGQGQYDLEQVRIEDTPIASFEEIETELVAPGGGGHPVRNRRGHRTRDRRPGVDRRERPRGRRGRLGRPVHRQPGGHEGDPDRHRCGDAARPLLRGRRRQPRGSHRRLGGRSPRRRR